MSFLYFCKHEKNVGLVRDSNSRNPVLGPRHLDGKTALTARFSSFPTIPVAVCKTGWGSRMFLKKNQCKIKIFRCSRRGKKLNFTYTIPSQKSPFLASDEDSKYSNFFQASFKFCFQLLTTRIMSIVQVIRFIPVNSW